MEYTQWADKESSFAVAKQSLNPCCNGIYSMRLITSTKQIMSTS